MQRNAIEPILGALVLVAAVAFLVFAYNKAGQRSFSGYMLTARFSSIDGLETGSDVRIGGVKVGQVTDISIDPETYLAMVKLTVAPEIKLPTDSVASITSRPRLTCTFTGAPTANPARSSHAPCRRNRGTDIAHSSGPPTLYVP